MKEDNFKIVAIIGLGLMGGSLGQAIKKNIKGVRVIGISRKKENLHFARKISAIDEGTTKAKEGVKDADLVVIATPVENVISTFKKIAPYVKDGSIITDLGSTKTKIVKEINDFRFIGGHPLCGSEQQGIRFAQDNLYENAMYILTPYLTPSSKLSSLMSFLRQIKVRPITLSCALHDYYVAGVSHLPHVVAGCLIRVVGNLKDKNKILKFSAGGFRDATRISSSSPSLWKDICLHNKDEIVKFLSLFIEETENIKSLIEKEKWEEVEKKFSQAKKIRDKLR